MDLHINISYLLSLQIAAMDADFEKLRQYVWDAGLMKVNPWFYIAHFGKFSNASFYILG